MSFNLSNLFSYHNSAAGQSGTTAGVSGSEASTQYKIANQLRQLAVGSSVTGEVVGINGNEVQIALDANNIINAKLDQAMQLVLGQNVTFMVKSHAGNQLSLSPLYTNTSMDPNVQKALQAAGLPINEDTANMVSSMMKEGMSIDKNSLLNMYKQVLANPEASANTIVQMNRLHILVTPENIQQFQAYENYEHSLTKGIETVAGQLDETVASLFKNGEGAQAFGTIKELLNILTANTPEQAAAEAVPENPQQVKAQLAEAALENLQQGKTPPAGGETVPVGEDVLNNKELQTGSTADARAVQTAVSDGQMRDLLTMAERGRLSQQLAALGVPEEVAAQVKTGSMNTEELMKLVKSLLENSNGTNQNMRALEELFSGKEFRSLLKSELTRQWLMMPADVATEGKVEDFYKNLSQQTARLAQALGEVAGDGTELMRSVNNIKQNVDFMQQLNQTFTYVQLPLKMQSGNANGDLYVYTNKKSLAQKDGNVSAYLHLEMEHLGDVDIYVAMQNNNVKTKFYLQDDEMLDFIESNIHILDERLEKRGYTMSTEMVKREVQGEEKESVFEKMVSAEKESNTLIAKYSFDARA